MKEREGSEREDDRVIEEARKEVRSTVTVAISPARTEVPPVELA